MGFSTFNVSELADDADDDFAIEFTTKSSRIGITLSEDEARGVGHALTESVEGDMDSWDGEDASEIAPE